MADALKRIAKSKDAAFKDRCAYYMYQKAAEVFAQETPDVNDLLLAQALWAGNVNMEDVAKVVVTNPDIGADIDNNLSPAEGDIEYVIISGTVFHEIAESYKEAGLIGA